MMPVLFVGHGSPMNAIEDNEFTQGWKRIEEKIPRPEAILCISAHWETHGTRVSVLTEPETIHDFYGFPKKLNEVQYPAKGSPSFAGEALDRLNGMAMPDSSWGLDHGAWSVLRIMYPKADIPVFQMSMDMNASPEEMFEMGVKLSPLREEGVLIVGSGNIVHNLSVLELYRENPFDWAKDFDDYVEVATLSGSYHSILEYGELGRMARMSVPTTEHFNPMLYVLGASLEEDSVEIYNKGYLGGSVSMTSYLFG